MHAMKYWWNSDIYYFKINIYLYQLYYNHETFSFSHTYNKTILVFANIINILHSYILHNYIFAFEWKIHFIFYILYYSYYIHRFRYHEIFNYFKLFQTIVIIIKPKKKKSIFINAKNKFVTGSYYVRIVKKTRVTRKYQF